MPTDSRRHSVAVIRVEVRSRAADGLLIELLEVGRDKGSDRPLGSATSAAQLCTIVERWLAHIASP
ncbi:hypothetical protein [Nocardia sp. XZ_19_231]|uniref:hypothetical protein n=1 Tax=Nocardia sp. XZ_19_231 TaxID=2769252 RepID=UPI00188DEDEE|nr:hypothetical protein [Nocardia sp. XZ_19_231]